jgi:Na+/melibiose symporter-like transporter
VIPVFEVLRKSYSRTELIELWKNESMKKNVVIKSWQYAILALGVSVCLLGALLMVAGESVLGENHSGIAAVVGIVGIGIIGLFTTTLTWAKVKERDASGSNTSTTK